MKNTTRRFTRKMAAMVAAVTAMSAFAVSASASDAENNEIIEAAKANAALQETWEDIENNENNEDELDQVAGGTNGGGLNACAFLGIGIGKTSKKNRTAVCFIIGGSDGPVAGFDEDNT